MTRQSMKRYERGVASACAMKLGENWTFQTEDREEPDFVVEIDSHSFGLEVVQCFIGRTTKRGSKLREKEAIDHAWLQDIRNEFGAWTAPLNVRYLGQQSPNARQGLLEVLRSEAWGERPIGFQVRRKLSGGMVYITVAHAPYWDCISNRVGWVSQDGKYIQACIDDKSKKLDRYTKINPDIRLLVVADRIFNSGKLAAPNNFQPDLRGFSTVYFYSYPDEVTVYRPI